MNIFPSGTPKLTKPDIERITPLIGNDKSCREFADACHDTTEIKLAVMVELRRGWVDIRRPILQKLLVRLQRLERSEIEKAMNLYVRKKTRR